MDWSILWWLVAVLIVIAGLAGTVVPALPGVPLVWVGLFVGAWIDNFEIVGWGTLGVMAALTVVGGVGYLRCLSVDDGRTISDATRGKASKGTP